MTAYHVLPPMWNIETRRNPWSFQQILSLVPTLFLDEREQTTTAGEISRWNNQVQPGGVSVNDNIGVSALTRPYTGSLINGYAAPAFSGSRIEAMTQASGTWGQILGPRSGSYSIFVVTRVGQISGSSTTAYLNPALWSDSAQYLGHYVNNVVSSSGIQFYNFDSAEKSTTSIPIVSGNVYIVEGYYSSGSKSETRVNNYITQSATTIGAIANAAGSWRLGGLGSAIATSYNGEIASVIAFNKSLSVERKTGIRKYLAQKYNVPLLGDGEDVPLTPAQRFGNALTIWNAASIGLSGTTLVDRWQSFGSVPCYFGATGGVRPDQSVYNGLISPKFNGINDVLASFSDSSLTTFLPFASASGDEQWEVFITGIANGLSGSGASPDLETTIFSCQTNNSHGITITNSGSRAFTTTTNGQSVTPYTSGTIVPHERFLLHASYNGNKIFCRYNSETPVSAAQSGSITNSTNEINLGRDTSVGADYYFNGNIFELLMFSRSLNLDEKHWVRTYLGTKWGIPFIGPTSTISASGNVSVGSYLTASLNGTLFDNIKWQRGSILGGGGDFYDISGANAVTYQVVSSDIGYSLRCFGTNVDGKNAVSNQLIYNSATDLSGTAIWVSTAGLTLADSNTTVNSWASSLGGITCSCFAPASSNRPAYGAVAGVGNRPLVTFDGISNVLSGTLTKGSAWTDYEWGMVGSRVSWGSTSDLWIAYYNANSHRFSLQDSNANTIFRTSVAGGANINSTTDPDELVTHYSADCDFATGAISLRITGTIETTTSGAITSRADGGFILFGGNHIGTLYSNIAAQAFYMGPFLSATQRTNLRALLSNYTGINC